MTAEIKRLRVKVCRLSKSKKSCTCSKSRTLSKKYQDKVRKTYALKAIKPYLSSAGYDFMATQIRLSGVKKKGFRYTAKEKTFYLNLYCCGPKLYKLFQTIFHLPSVRTLQRLLASLDINPGLNKSLLNALRKQSVKWSDQDKMCSLLIDEMSLKERLYYNQNTDCIDGFECLGSTQNPFVANHSSVFMVRGLTRKWKQSIGYFLSSGPVKATSLKTLVIEAIREIRSTGLNLVSLICDQGSNNQSMLSHLGVSVNTPYFYVDGKPVFVMYDPPHVLKNTRNNMFSSGYTLNGKIIDWGVIKSLYQYDKERKVRMCPKLTDKHVYLEGFGIKMKVKLAAQVLSHSTAAAIETMVELQQWSGPDRDRALATANFCDSINSLFDVFNSKSIYGTTALSRAITKNSKHFDFLSSCMEWLPALQAQGKPEGHTQLPCIRAWQLNINSLKYIWNIVQSFNVDQLCTNRLNQDALENFFSMVRGKYPHDDRPDSKQFRAIFRTLSIQSLFKLAKNANCEEDIDRFVIEADSLADLQSQSPDPNTVANDHSYYISQVIDNDVEMIASTSETPANNVQNNPSDISGLPDVSSFFDIFTGGIDLQDSNVVSYISGYLIKKTFDKFKCDSCYDLQTQNRSVLQSDNNFLFIKHKMYKDLSSKGLAIPSNNFLGVFKKCECKVRQFMPLVVNNNGIAYRLFQLCYDEMKQLPVVHCGEDMCIKSIHYMLKLFIKIRIYHVVKEENRRISQPNMKRNRKFMKVTHL